MKLAVALILTGFAGAFPLLTLSADVEGRTDVYHYVVVPGDTLIGISQRLLRDPALWPEVQRLNQIKNPRRIPPTTQLRIPYEWLRAASQPFTIEVVVGVVDINGSRAAAGQAANAPATLKTGADGFVIVRLVDGSRFRLRSNSELRVEVLDRLDADGATRTQVWLESGKVETDASTQRDGNRFEVRSPLAITAVRGTNFRVGVNPQESFGTSEVIEGAVAVVAPTGAVAVEAGFGTRVEPGRALEAPVRLLVAPDLSLTADNSGAPNLLWETRPVDGAVAYFAQLTRTSVPQEVIATSQGAAPGGSFGALSDGEYGLQVAAIDRLGLEGATAVKVIARRRLAQIPTLSPMTRIVGTNFGFRCEVPAGARCDWQVSIHPDFRDISREGITAEPAVTLVRLVPGRYYLRARNLDSDGRISEFAPVQELHQGIRAWIGAKFRPNRPVAPP
jgi:hypothetical protein